MKKLNAIIEIKPAPGTSVFCKYRIANNSKDKFVSWVKKKIPHAHHINFYDKETRKFMEQIKL